MTISTVWADYIKEATHTLDSLLIIIYVESYYLRISAPAFCSN